MNSKPGWLQQEAANGRGDAGKVEAARKDKAASKLSVERVYQKKTQLEHILLRPDTYIGSVEPVTQVSPLFNRSRPEKALLPLTGVCKYESPNCFLLQQMWVFDEEVGMNQREITYVPGLYKIFDEILGEWGAGVVTVGHVTPEAATKKPPFPRRGEVAETPVSSQTRRASLCL